VKRGRPKGSILPAYAEVLAFARARLLQVDGPDKPTEAVREAIEALGIDLAGLVSSHVRMLLPTTRELERGPRRKRARRGRYTLASDDYVVEYLARRIVRNADGI
jgi:hypothetical protein